MIVWPTIVDNKYLCSVERTAEYQGKLTIEDETRILYTTPVVLSYDANFGPDLADVTAWKEVCLGWIDGW